ncbi:PIN domain-containing protein [Ponticoccus sp. SC2-23]|uniref:RSP_2648 family PIN domain-containing protein n=1 Tax=Alexandriicola marinus TaxID=2081710 RepID=UPI000FD7874B|nr:PIN domain-containing protein [Alexandriicola marinus]MBM1219141.1 PIN domain-containing protein [Ponticoccus sp. SC6-9]MBM1223787.1 PIN domain-containing protein [Ponticoccus sp. SC6-15]MBM1228955.1 PIN domain-containing protein [Ponticoccus sp. SC6-38]MBM1232753.1 PIN domain-containing protein [Ponticoccus sp. SC6-45]MBM1237297.1 PIN domain-containing protein [Ponticoccus sp. SC6-49]MBM1241764.1 PIN domain-containing protein [Ponticoccus sp. SC2-64]MBM1246277.1 PIN domain-containing pro
MTRATPPRVVLDACVIFPTVTREMLLGAAREGFFTPRWSDRITEEWVRAAAKLGPEGEILARGEAARLDALWPDAAIPRHEGLEARLWLPDPADVHVLAAAIAGSCDGIVTVNAKDFPRNILAEEGLFRADPDAFLLGFRKADPARMGQVADRVLAQARRLSGDDWSIRALMKKARLPRLGKALDQA